MPPRVAASIAKLLSLDDDKRIIGPFRLTRQLGRGGFAPVWLAKEVYGGAELRTVALKLFALDEVFGGSGTGSGTSATHRQIKRDQIVSEARALCQVEHPNVVRFLSIASDDEGTVLGLAMEYVNGTPLDQKISERGRLDVDEALAVGCAVASALGTVHENGLVHCDIKPANVIDAVGVYKLIDFGIAAVGQRSARRIRKRRAGKSGIVEPIAIAEAPTMLAPSQAEPAPAAATTAAPATGATIVHDDLPFFADAAPPPSVVLDDLPLEGPISRSAPSQSGSRSLGTGGSLGTGFGASGTIGYMDPACVQSGAAPTPASDLYALGAMLFECLTGQLPAVAAARRESSSGMKPEVLDGRAPAPPIGEIVTDLPPTLSRLVDALLQPEPRKRPRSTEIVAWELERVRRERAGRSRPLPPEERGPFRGLGRFEEADRDVYFGRSAEIAAGLEMIRRRGLVALIGPSGSGKSSLARAGLLPAVLDGELGGWPKEWDSVVLTPGEDPRAAIGAALEPFIEEAALAEPEALAVSLADIAAESARGIVLLVDQLEELVTVASGPSQAWATSFLACLGQQALPGVRCIVAARRDLLDELLALDELGRILTRGTLLVSPLSDVAWEDVVDHALEAYGYRLEDAAMRTLLLEQLKGTSSAMPLVQFALTRLWERRDTTKKIIPKSALDAIGGIGGALEAHADATLAALGDDARPVARAVLLELTTAQGTRAMRPIAELRARIASDHTDTVVDALLAARLLVSEAEGLTLAHEALLVRWGALRRWIAEAREDRLRAEEIEHEAAAWLAEHRAPERLLKKRRLRAAEDLLAKGGALLGPVAIELVHASKSAERRARFLMASPLLVVAVGVLAVLLFRWDASRIKLSRCATITTRWQVAECVSGPLSAEAASHSALSFRLSTKDGRVVKVERLNGSGVLKNDDDGFAWSEYVYDASGRVQEIVRHDRHGEVKLRERYSDDLKRNERRDAFNLPLPLSTTDNSTSETKSSNATVVRYEFDAQGFVLKERFFSTYDRPRPDAMKAFGYAFRRDARGLWTSADVLGPDGNPSPTDEGFAHATRKYDASGNVTEMTYLDLENKPAILDAHFSTWRATFDAGGNELARTFHNVDGSLSMTKWGYARFETRYDDAGNAVERAFFDTEDALTVLPQGFSGYWMRHDAKGNETEYVYFGTDRRPTVIANGFSSESRTYDARGEWVDVRYFGLGGVPTIHADGNHRLVRKLDARANEIERSYLGTDGRPVLVSNYARAAYRFDERDKLVEMSFYGLDGRLVLNKSGYARVTYAYDEAGQERETAYFGIDGAPILKDGYARFKRAWMDGNNIETSFFGVDGKPTLGAGGYFLEAAKFDDRGNKIEEAFFGTDGKTPVIHWSEARHAYEYDSRGRRVAEAHFGLDGAPILLRGVARQEEKFDDRGRRVEQRYFGIEGKPITGPDLYAWRAWKYDERGNAIEEAYFAFNDKPTKSKDEVAGWRAKFDDRDHEIEREYFGTSGDATLVKGKGYARVTKRYDAFGRESERAYFAPGGGRTLVEDKNGAYAKTAAVFDERGNELERAYFGTDDHPILHDGFARRVRSYDERGHEREDAYFGVDGKPTRGSGGYARAVRSYDDRGNVLEESFFDENDKAVRGDKGYASQRARYDARGHLLEKSFFDEDGKPVVSEDEEFARVVTRVDELGNEVERVFEGADGHLRAKGPARITSKLEAGNVIERRWFGKNGEPIATSGGFARVASKFDAQAHEIEHAIFDTKNEPATGEEGWSSWKATFDEFGHEIDRAFFDAQGKHVTTKKGFARTSARFDELGHELEREWYGADDKPIAVEGVARTVARFNEWGKEIELATFGADAKPIAKGGFAKKTTRYDRQGRATETAFYGADGKLVVKDEWARQTVEYDSAGNVSRVAYFGANGQPMKSKDDIASFAKKYDERNVHVEERYYDEKGALTLDNNGVAILRMEHDDLGNEIKRTFFGKDEKPILSKDGIAGWMAKYDAQGHEIEHSLFGLDDKPAALKNVGWARWTAVYDEQGHRVEQALFGPDLAPYMLASVGWAKRTWKYDEHGHETESAHYGADGALALFKGEAYARIATKYDGRGNVTEEAFFDAKNERVKRSGGYAIVRVKYDGSNHEIERAYFDVNDKPTQHTDGYARYTAKYDEAGRLSEATFYDVEGNVAANKNRCATLKWSYDAKGKKKDVKCFDVAGKEVK